MMITHPDVMHPAEKVTVSMTNSHITTVSWTIALSSGLKTMK